MTTGAIFLSVLFMGFACSFGCSTITTPFILGSLLGEGKNISESRKAIALFSLGKIISLSLMGLFAGIFGSIILTYVEEVLPDATTWLVRIVTVVFAIKIISSALKKEESSCSGCSSCPASCASQESKKLPKSYLVTGLLYGFIPCAPLITSLTYASTMSPLVGMLLLGSFGVVNSLVPVLMYASLVGLANTEFATKSSKYLKYIKLSGGIILILAAIFKI